MNVTPEIEAKMDRMWELGLTNQRNTREFVELAVELQGYIASGESESLKHFMSRRGVVEGKLGLA